MDYLITYENGNNAILHYGVKGMKWRHHKDTEQQGGGGIEEDRPSLADEYIWERIAPGLKGTSPGTFLGNSLMQGIREVKKGKAKVESALFGNSQNKVIGVNVARYGNTKYTAMPLANGRRFTFIERDK